MSNELKQSLASTAKPHFESEIDEQAIRVLAGRQTPTGRIAAFSREAVVLTTFDRRSAANGGFVRMGDVKLPRGE